MAHVVHAMANEYHTDPYTVAFEWTLERFDFNQSIYLRHLAIREEAERKAEAKANRKNK